MQTEIEDKLAEQRLLGNVKQGDSLKVDCKGEDKDRELVFKPIVKKNKVKELVTQ